MTMMVANRLDCTHSKAGLETHEYHHLKRRQHSQKTCPHAIKLKKLYPPQKNKKLNQKQTCMKFKNEA